MRTAGVMAPQEARRMVRAFALVVVAQKVVEDPLWRQAFTRRGFRRAVAAWILDLEDRAPRVFAEAAHHAWMARDGNRLALFLEHTLGLDLMAECLLALRTELAAPGWRKRDPERVLLCLRFAVGRQAARIHRKEEMEARLWGRLR